MPDEPWRATLKHERTEGPEGDSLYYEVLGRGDRVMLLCNGLGGRLYSWGPLLDRFWESHRLITWDYRGLFESYSGKAPVHRRLAIPAHADDARAILDAEGVDECVLVGWSMGVQVALELAASFPERVRSLVLLNGTYGHAMSTALQPIASVPWLPKYLHSATETLRRKRALQTWVKRGVRVGVPVAPLAFTLTAGRRAFAMRHLLARYYDDVLGPSFENFLRLFQELDAHSVYHVLPEIAAPALVVSGALDPLTPQRQSFEIARRLPNAQHVALARASHFALLERPDVVLPAIEEHLHSTSDGARTSST